MNFKESARFKTVFYVAIFLSTVQVSAALPGSVRGFVYDKITKERIPQSIIQIGENAKGTITNENGVFVIDSLPEGTYTLTISAVGYKKYETAVKVISGNNSSINVPLSLDIFNFSEVLVSANREMSAASSQYVSAMDFELRPKQSSQDILRVVPGLVTAQHAGGGKAEQIFLRGFDADHGTDVNISIDGIPVNMVSHGHGQGYADLHFVMPEVLQGIEVYKGPYFAQHGDFGTAGTVTFSTLDMVEDNTVKAEIGSFDFRRAVGISNLPLNIDGLSSYVAGEFFSTQSYFEQPQNFERYNLFAKSRYALTEGNVVTAWVSGFGSTWDASGQIPDRAVKSGMIDRFGAIDAREGGSTYRNNLSLSYVNTYASSILKTSLFVSTYTFRLFSNFTFYKEDPVLGDGIEQQDDRTIFGGKAEILSESLFGMKNVQSMYGATMRSDDIDVGLFHSPGRIRMETRSLASIRQTSLSLYTQQTITLSSSLLLSLGARLDHFRFDVTDKLNPGTSEDISGSIDQTLVSPKANLRYQVTDRWNLFLNSGFGFHSNDARVVTAQKGSPTLPRAFGSEIGTRFTDALGITIGAAAWLLDLEREFVFVGDEGTTEESGRTRRVGIDVDVHAQILSWLLADIDVSFSRGRSIDSPDGTNYIPLAPTMTSTGGLTARHNSGIEASLRYRFVNDRPANEDNSVHALGYTVVDFTTSYQIGVYRFGAGIENLFNVDWNEAQFDTESRLLSEPVPVSELHFTPGTPRSIKLTAGILF